METRQITTKPPGGYVVAKRPAARPLGAAAPDSPAETWARMSCVRDRPGRPASSGAPATPDARASAASRA
jgi:hypothetical protein